LGLIFYFMAVLRAPHFHPPCRVIPHREAEGTFTAVAPVL
jgi:hypothetical protein